MKTQAGLSCRQRLGSRGHPTRNCTGTQAEKVYKEEYFPEGRWAIAGERSGWMFPLSSTLGSSYIIYAVCSFKLLKLQLVWAFPEIFPGLFITFLIFTSLYNAVHMHKLCSSAPALLSNPVDMGVIDTCIFISPCPSCLSSSPAK